MSLTLGAMGKNQSEQKLQSRQKTIRVSSLVGVAILAVAAGAMAIYAMTRF
jgi:hypothetical protein